MKKLYLGLAATVLVVAGVVVYKKLHSTKGEVELEGADVEETENEEVNDDNIIEDTEADTIRIV